MALQAEKKNQSLNQEHKLTQEDLCLIFQRIVLHEKQAYEESLKASQPIFQEEPLFLKKPNQSIQLKSQKTPGKEYEITPNKESLFKLRDGKGVPSTIVTDFL